MAKEIIITHHNVSDFATALDMIRKAQRDLYYVANTTLIDLYWNLGKHISDRITEAGWGKGTVNELAKYIGENEPNVSGFSASNLWRMRQFYETYSENEKLAPLVREIAPQAKKIFRDTYVMEFITGEEAKPENSLHMAMLHNMNYCCQTKSYFSSEYEKFMKKVSI